ncbi:hypothetical protein JCM5353_000128 [Sporobolomyces roseus]
MAPDLPKEVLDSIIAFTSASPIDLSHLALVSTQFAQSVQFYRSFHTVLSSSTQTQQYLKRSSSKAGSQVQSIILERGRRTRAEKVKVGRSKVVREVEDSITEEELVKLCHISSKLVELRLDQLSFTSLRRRQVSFAASLSHLTRLSIIGRRGSDDGGFSLTTVGQILETLPQLLHLKLRNLRSSAQSLSGLSPPTFHLRSFTLYTPPFLSSSQLSWLLDSSTFAESLRTLDFALPLDVLPSTLHSIYWAPIRVTSIHISSDNVQAIESMPSHCPHLERLSFDSSARIDVRRILKNALQYRRLNCVRDLSVDKAGGVDLRQMAEDLLRYQRKLRIRKIVIRSERKEEDGYRELKVVCQNLRILLEETGQREILA